MGPRFGALNVPERWLPWHAAGVLRLLRDPAAEAGDAADHLGEAPRPVLADSAAEEGRGDLSAPEAPVGSVQSKDRPPARVDDLSPPVRAAEPSSFARPVRPEQPSLAASPLPPGAVEAPWPPPWDGFLAKAPPAPWAVFTYLELGLDLGGQASDARRALFRDILGALRQAGWPAGGVAFWPLAAPAPDGALAADRDMFWRGVETLGATVVCLFGRPAWEALFPGRRHVLGPLRERGRSLLVLPGPADMLPDNRSAKGLAWKLLRGLDPGGQGRS